MRSSNQTTFDWKDFVAKNRPSSAEDASVSQQFRQQLLTSIVLPDLNQWASRLNLPALWPESQLDIFKKRLYGSAFTGVFSLADRSNQADPLLPLQAQSTARFALWLFALDNYLDTLDFDLNNLKEVGNLQAATNSIAAIIEIIAAPISDETEGNQTGVSELTDKPKASPFYLPVALTHKANLLKAALHDIYQSLGQVIQTSPGPVETKLALSTFAKETWQVIKVMQAEVGQSLAYQLSGEQVGLEAYLNSSKFSIGLGGAASIAFIFEPPERQTREIWQAWQAALETGAKTLRLVNDCANYQREIEEGKLNALTIVLTGLGYNRAEKANDDQNSFLAEALRTIKHRIAQELAAFIDAVPATASAEAKLDYCVLSCVAFTIALYQGRDFEL